jgi:hypothetical protein
VQIIWIKLFIHNTINHILMVTNTVSYRFYALSEEDVHDAETGRIDIRVYLNTAKEHLLVSWMKNLIFISKILSGISKLKDPGVNGKAMLERQTVRLCIEFVWLMICFSPRQLHLRYQTSVVIYGSFCRKNSLTRSATIRFSETLLDRSSYLNSILTKVSHINISVFNHN